jgi:hypothetical protein
VDPDTCLSPDAGQAATTSHTAARESFYGGRASSHGLKTTLPAFMYSSVSRETIVSPCCKAVAAMKRSGCEKRVPDSPSLLDQEAPFDQHVFTQGQHSLLEHWAHPVCQPGAKLSPADGLRQQLDTKADLSEGDDADEQCVKRLRANERHDLWLGSRATQLRYDVGIEKPSYHSDTSRTGSAARPGSISTSRCGEAWIASIRACPVTSPFSRRNSSAAITTTSSRP